MNCQATNDGLQCQRPEGHTNAHRATEADRDGRLVRIVTWTEMEVR